MPNARSRDLELTTDLGSSLGRGAEALAARIREVRAARWREENRAAIDAYNARVDEEGTFGEQFGNL